MVAKKERPAKAIIVEKHESSTVDSDNEEDDEEDDEERAEDLYGPLATLEGRC